MKLNGIQRGKNPSEMTPEESYRLLEDFSLKTSLKSPEETNFNEEYSAEGEEFLETFSLFLATVGDTCLDAFTSSSTIGEEKLLF